MTFQFASRHQTFILTLFAVVLGLSLAIGFQPASVQLGKWVLSAMGSPDSPVRALLELGFFPVLSLFFYLSLPSIPFSRPYWISRNRLILMSLLPFIISFIFGQLKPFKTMGSDFQWRNLVIWAWIIVPIGEEFLFRGWLLDLFQRVFRNIFAPSLPFLPLSVWGQAIAFSLWHIQNLGQTSPYLVGLQLFYTFFVGIWLGLLRWQTGSLFVAILAHCLLNMLADWKLWFVI